jgi:hypothetical protein
LESANERDSIWHEILNACAMDERLQDIAKQEVCVLVGNGHDTNFWNDVWLGNSYLTVWFPRIYNLSEDNVSSIANMGLWDSFFGIWNFK